MLLNLAHSENYPSPNSELANKTNRFTSFIKYSFNMFLKIKFTISKHAKCFLSVSHLRWNSGRDVSDKIAKKCIKITKSTFWGKTMREYIRRWEGCGGTNQLFG